MSISKSKKNSRTPGSRTAVHVLMVEKKNCLERRNLAESTTVRIPVLFESCVRTRHPFRWGKRHIHQIPFVVNNNRADVKTTVAILRDRRPPISYHDHTSIYVTEKSDSFTHSLITISPELLKVVGLFLSWSKDQLRANFAKINPQRRCRDVDKGSRFVTIRPTAVEISISSDVLRFFSEAAEMAKNKIVIQGHIKEVLSSHGWLSGYVISVGPLARIPNHYIDKLNHIKLVKTQSSYVGMMWKFGELVQAQKVLLPWAARSLDFSRIEKIWSLVNERLDHHLSIFAAIDKAWNRLEAKWNDLPISVIQAQFGSIPNWIKTILAARAVEISISSDVLRFFSEAAEMAKNKIVIQGHIKEVLSSHGWLSGYVISVGPLARIPNHYIDKLNHIKLVKTQSSYVGMMWKFGELVQAQIEISKISNLVVSITKMLIQTPPEPAPSAVDWQRVYNDAISLCSIEIL
ncbi:hypothetical protein TNCV_959541 [Trichonephila clavipes]|nr:hypothetical protein TNCV_959541 [Trichonephila clavipes]